MYNRRVAIQSAFGVGDNIYAANTIVGGNGVQLPREHLPVVPDAAAAAARINQVYEGSAIARIISVAIHIVAASPPGIGLPMQTLDEDQHWLVRAPARRG